MSLQRLLPVLGAHYARLPNAVFEPVDRVSHATTSPELHDCFEGC